MFGCELHDLARQWDAPRVVPGRQRAKHAADGAQFRVALEAEPRRTRVGGLWGAQWRYRCEVDGSEVQSWDVVAQSDRAFISVCMSASVEVVWDSAEADFVRFLDSLELS